MKLLRILLTTTAVCSTWIHADVGAAQTPPAAAPAAAAPASNVGVVDLQKALNTCNEGKRAKERLEADFRRRQQELDRAKHDLETFAHDLESSSSMLTPEAKQQRAQEYQQRFTELQDRFQQHQRELSQAEEEATRGIMSRLVDLAGRIAQEKHLTVVVEKNSVVFAAPAVDFTDELIRRFDAGGH